MITTIYGLMDGVRFDDYMEYRRVPYAKPPVGELRFRKPQKPDCWDGIYYATEYAPSCIQDDTRAGEPWAKDFYMDKSFLRPMSEDCLYLNIWTPLDTEPEHPYPVALWIHGGAFLGGYATESEFDGAAYAKRGVILVSVEYRCNVFGYLAHPWLSQEDEDGISGNYGSYDQIAALDWVIENISAFGGDPANITVFGQSAGAMSTQTLISSPLCKGKIQRAILQSGGSYGSGLHRDISLKEQEDYGKKLTDLLQVTDLDELRALPAKEVFAKGMMWMGQIMASGEAMGLFLIPTMDGSLLTDGYYKLIENDQILDIPYMIGWTRDDIDVMSPDRALQDENRKETILKKGSIAFSHKLTDLGRKGAYVYAFDRQLPGDGWGAYHSAELFYMFGTLGRTWRPWSQKDYLLSEAMLDYWTNFMKTGDPNGNRLPEWKTCSREDSFVMTFDI